MSIVAIVFGSIVTVIFLGVLGGIIKAWINRGSGKNLTENEEFLEAIRDFKEKTDRRLATLEAIAVENSIEKPEKERTNKKNIELKEEFLQEPPKKQSGLKNMLNE